MSTYAINLIGTKTETTETKIKIDQKEPEIARKAIADSTNLPSCSKKFIICDLSSRNSTSLALSHLVLNNLSCSAKDEIKLLLSQFGKLIEKYNLDTQDLDFLLKATPDARCLMVPKWTPDQDTRIRLIRDFINTSLKAKDEVYPEDFDAKAKLYAENLEAFATAMGYSALNPSNPSLGPSWVKKDGFASENLKLMIQDLALGPFIVASIGEREEWAHAFPKRADENIPFQTQELASSSNEVIHANEEYIENDTNENQFYIINSYEQEPIDNTGTTRTGLDSRAFSYNSYVTRGLKECVAMRAHVSGSAPLTLAAFRFFDASDGKQTRFENHFIRAGLIIAIYALGDYHSISETAAGICHYHQRESYTQGENDRIYTHEDISGNPTTNYLEEISPIVFQNIGLGHLGRITDEKSQDAFTALSQNLLTEVPSRQAKAPSFIATSNKEETSSYFTSSTFFNWISSMDRINPYNLFSRAQEPFNRPAYTL